MQYLGNVDGTVLHHWDTPDSSQVFLGKDAKKADSLQALLHSFPAAMTTLSDTGEETELFPLWDHDHDYQPGDWVRYHGKNYEAMSDVSEGYAPDDIYDLDADTGGWKPL